MGQAGNQPLMRKTYGNVTSVLKGVGVFAFFFFVILSFYNSPNLALLPHLEHIEALGVLAAGTAAAAAVSLAIGFFPQVFASHLPRTFLMGGVLLLPMLANGFLQQYGFVADVLTLPCTVASWLCFGAALSFILSACASYLYCTCFDSTTLVIGAGACVGTALFAFLVLLQNPLACLVIATVICCAGCAAAVVFSRGLRQDQDEINRKRQESRIQRGKMSVSAVFSTFIQVVILGYILASPQGMSPLLASQAFCVGCLVAAFLFVFTSVKLKWVSDLQGICLLTMPVVLAALVVSQTLGDLGSLLCYGLIVIALSYHYFVYWQDSICICRATVFEQCSHHARSHGAVFAAALLGLLLHMAVMANGAGQDEVEPLVNSALVVALCAAFMIFALSNRSFSAGSCQVAPSPSPDGAKPDSRPQDCASAPPGSRGDAASSGPKEGAFRLEEQCAAVATRFALTDREAEVLVLLAKGRNAEHIMGALSISRSTVKSHISSIYRKTGVHKQQQLISIVDDQAQREGEGMREPRFQ